MKKVMIVLLGLGLIGGGIGFYQYTKPASTEVGESIDERVSADALFSAYADDEVKANNRFLGKIVAVSGRVSSRDGTTVSLSTEDPMGLVLCAFAELSDDRILAEGEEIAIVGACDGFTGFDVQLSKCRFTAQ